MADSLGEEGPEAAGVDDEDDKSREREALGEE